MTTCEVCGAPRSWWCRLHPDVKPPKKVSTMNLHEPVDRPNWDTKIVCTCGERCSNWMEFYRHRGDAYKKQLEERL